MITVLAGLWLCRNLWIRGEELAAVSVCAMIALFCSPVSWSHHWIPVIPLGVSLLTASRLGRRWPIPVTAAWFGAFMLAPIWWPPRRDNLELSWNFAETLAGNSYLWLSLAVNFLLTLGSRRKETQPVEKLEIKRTS